MFVKVTQILFNLTVFKNDFMNYNQSTINRSRGLFNNEKAKL